MSLPVFMMGAPSSALAPAPITQPGPTNPQPNPFSPNPGFQAPTPGLGFANPFGGWNSTPPAPVATPSPNQGVGSPQSPPWHPGLNGGNYQGGFGGFGGAGHQLFGQQQFGQQPQQPQPQPWHQQGQPAPGWGSFVGGSPITPQLNWGTGSM